MAFDLTVHHKNPNSGKIERVTPYQYRVSKNAPSYFLRDGRFYWPNGDEMQDDEVASVEANRKGELPVSDDGMPEAVAASESVVNTEPVAVVQYPKVEVDHEVSKKLFGQE